AAAWVGASWVGGPCVGVSGDGASWGKGSWAGPGGPAAPLSEAGDFGGAGARPPLPGGCGERGRFAPPGGLPGRPERLRPLAGRFFCVMVQLEAGGDRLGWDELDFAAAASIASIWLLSWGRETAPRILVPKRVPCSSPWPMAKKWNWASMKKVSGTPRTPNAVASSPPRSTTLG